MKYIDKNTVLQLGNNWEDLISIIVETIDCISNNKFSQPIKPYLRFNEKKNRIIAMPAYLGGDFNIAGIKWIASFPENIKKGITRANSITVLNNAETGVPECIINTSEISSIRTAAVTGAVLKKILSFKDIETPIIIGINGYGPIAKMHIEMLKYVCKDLSYKIKIYDVNKAIDKSNDDNLTFHDSYEDFFCNADIFITATNSSEPYIDLRPKKGSLHLNVSLRDYKSSFIHQTDKIIVDNWEEVCRENTDIEKMHLNEGLKKEDTFDLTDIFIQGKLNNLKSSDVIMFNPMGMAVFDIAVAWHYYNQSLFKNLGYNL